MTSIPCSDQPSASTAASPPSVVALPPTATMMLLETLTARDRDQLARPARARAQRIVATRNQREPARARHLDDRDAARQHTPLRVDRIAERTGDARDATRAAARREQRVERAFAAVGERQLDDVFETGAPQPGRDRGRGFVGPQRAPELVGTGNARASGHEHR